MQHYSQIPFAGPSSLVNANGTASIAPQDTTLQPPQLAPQPPQPSQLPEASGLVAKGDWTKDLVKLAKTAELKYVTNSFVKHSSFFAFTDFPFKIDRAKS
jgi:hypothetical protein